MKYGVIALPKYHEIGEGTFNAIQKNKLFIGRESRRTLDAYTKYYGAATTRVHTCCEWCRTCSAYLNAKGKVNQAVAYLNHVISKFCRKHKNAQGLCAWQALKPHVLSVSISIACFIFVFVFVFVYVFKE